MEVLQKIKLGQDDGDTTAKKGFVSGSDKLWLSVVNAKIHNLIKESEETVSISKQQKRILKFVKSEVTPARTALFNQMQNETSLERKLIIETNAKQTLALEKLILSLTLTLCAPGVEMNDLTDTLE